MTRTTKQDRPLQGMRILVADDEILIAMNMEDSLREAGAEVVSAATIESALNYIESEPISAAVLDVRLGTGDTKDVADVLFSRGIPFVFYSGHILPDHMQARYPGVQALIKPIRSVTILETLLAACSASGGADVPGTVG
jgi:DNA-binding NtrC family response regulator